MEKKENRISANDGNHIGAYECKGGKQMTFDKKFMSFKEMRDAGVPETMLLRARMERGQKMVCKMNPTAKNSPLIYDTEEFERWWAKQAKILTQSIPGQVCGGR